VNTPRNEKPISKKHLIDVSTFIETPNIVALHVHKNYEHHDKIGLEKNTCSHYFEHLNQTLVEQIEPF
jgi:hypothetical protein